MIHLDSSGRGVVHERVEGPGYGPGWGAGCEGSEPGASSLSEALVRAGMNAMHVEAWLRTSLVLAASDDVKPQGDRAGDRAGSRAGGPAGLARDRDGAGPPTWADLQFELRVLERERRAESLRSFCRRAMRQLRGSVAGMLLDAVSPLSDTADETVARAMRAESERAAPVAEVGAAAAEGVTGGVTFGDGLERDGVSLFRAVLGEDAPRGRFGCIRLAAQLATKLRPGFESSLCEAEVSLVSQQSTRGWHMPPDQLDALTSMGRRARTPLAASHQLERLQLVATIMQGRFQKALTLLARDPIEVESSVVLSVLRLALCARIEGNRIDGHAPVVAGIGHDASLGPLGESIGRHTSIERQLRRRIARLVASVRTIPSQESR